MYAKLKTYLAFHKEGFEGLKLVHQADASAIPVSLLYAFVKAIYPYIQFFFGAAIIDALIGQQFKRAFLLVGGLVGGQLVLGIIQDILQRVDDYKAIKVARIANVKVRKKALEIDYETLEDAKTLEQLNSAVYALQYKGGFGQLLQHYCCIFEAVFSVITALGLVGYLCTEIVKGTGGILGVLTSTPVSLLAVLGVVGIMIVGNFLVEKHVNDENIAFFKSQLKAERTLNYYISQVMTDYEKGKVIRLYKMNGMINERFATSNEFIKKTFSSFFPITYNENKAHCLLGGVTLVFAYLFAVLKVVVGAISIGDLTKYVGAITQLNNGMIQFVKYNDEIRMQCEYLKTFTDFMKLPNKRETGSIPVEKRQDNEYEIGFHNVSFAYPGSNEYVLKNVSCTITMKHKMAVVGPNGAGKTTFIKLITRLYDPTEGYITLNGIDIRKYDYNEYIELFGVVFQDFSLFAFPIEQNVATSTEVEEQRVWEMLELAGVKERVKEMPQTIKTPLYKYDEGGVECSGGEMQKLAIARALYKDAPFVILDEPTAALDPVSEYEIYSRFDELVKDKTSIYISHRMSSCRFCDDIMVFEEGKLVQRGSHEVLMEEGDKLYASLWEAQASYYVS